MASSPQVDRAPALKRQLGLASATALIAGQTIAVGIFLTPGSMARSLGSPFWVLVIWLAMGLMTFCGALCYSALACRWPETGGSYIYLRHAYGPRLAFLYGWMCMVVMDPGLCAALATGFASYCAYLVPATAATQRLIALAVVLAIAALNALGTRLSAAFLNAVTWLKIAVLVGLPAWALAARAGDARHFLPFVERRAGGEPLAVALAGAFVAAFFSFGGWWELSRVAGEVREPARTLPRALLLGVMLVLVVYLGISAVFMYVVPLEAPGDPQAFVGQLGARLFGAIGGQVLAGVVALSIVSSLAAFMMAVPRVYYAMAQQGAFLHAMAAVSPRFGTPVRAIALQAVLGGALILAGSFEQIIAYFIFTAVLFLGLTVASVFPLARRGELARGFGARRAASVFLLLVAVLLALLAAGRPRETLAGLAVTAAGAAFYPRRAAAPARA